MPDLHIASCVARIQPAQMDAAIAAIEAISGSDISARNAIGKVVVLIEGASAAALIEQMERIRHIPGVLNIELVYQHAEEESVMKEFLP